MVHTDMLSGCFTHQHFYISKFKKKYLFMVKDKQILAQPARYFFKFSTDKWGYVAELKAQCAVLGVCKGFVSFHGLREYSLVHP